MTEAEKLVRDAFIKSKLSGYDVPSGVRALLVHTWNKAAAYRDAQTSDDGIPDVSPKDAEADDDWIAVMMSNRDASQAKASAEFLEAQFIAGYLKKDQWGYEPMVIGLLQDGYREGFAKGRESLQEAADFGMQCLQDQYENAFIEQTVVDKIRAELREANAEIERLRNPDREAEKMRMLEIESKEELADLRALQKEQRP